MNSDYCWASCIDLYIIFKNGRPYVNFVYCCVSRLQVLAYPLEDVCKNFDEYYNRAVKIIVDSNICKKCNLKLQNEDLNNKNRYRLVNCTSVTCSHGCKYCGAKTLFKYSKKINQYNTEIMKQILTSKSIVSICPSACGEPFEDSYIRNEFMFNLHKMESLKNVHILTNAVWLDKIYLEKLYEYLKTHNIKYTFTINISGSNKKDYELYCNSDFNTVIENINNIINLFGDEAVKIDYILSKHNQTMTRKQVLSEFEKILIDHKRLNDNLISICDYTLYKTIEESNKRLKAYYEDPSYEETKFTNLSIPPEYIFNRDKQMETIY